ncbi:MAG: YigZ family protein [Bacteroidetes bacterium]|jgi:uncharacterized YigZ family protein|nr:YigZ family protein [Bacteroidota bacterium]
MSVASKDFYLTITQPSVAEYKDRGSKFIAYAYPIKLVDEFKVALKQVKELHPKASHHCFAYKIGLDNNTFRVSDDGEPSSSAGRPILNAIESKEITDVLIVVVRYFGGTLLGVPGLINAYKHTALLALQVTPIVQKPILNIYELQFDYTLKNNVMSIVKQLSCEVLENENQLFCIMKVGVQTSKEADFVHRLKDYHTISFKKI